MRGDRSETEVVAGARGLSRTLATPSSHRNGTFSPVRVTARQVALPTRPRVLGGAGTPVRPGILGVVRGGDVRYTPSARSFCTFLRDRPTPNQEPRPREPREQPLTARPVAAAHRAGARRRQRGQQRARAFAGLGAGRAGRAGHRVRPRRGGPRLRLHRRRRRTTCPCPAAATPPRWPRCAAACRTPTSCTRTGCTPPSAPRSRSAGGAPRSSSPGTPARTAEGARAHLLRLLERRVAKAAAVVLGTSSDLVDRARGRGARDARLAAVAAAGAAPAAEPADPDGRPKVAGRTRRHGRPLLIAVGSLDRHRGYDTLLDAARAWRRLDPVPLLVIAGEGPLRRRSAAPDRGRGAAGPAHRAARRRRASCSRPPTSRCCPAAGSRARVLAQEALHARVPLVATARRRHPRTGRRRAPNSSRTATRRRSPTPSLRLLGDPARRRCCGRRAPGRPPPGRPRTRRSPKC